MLKTRSSPLIISQHQTSRGRTAKQAEQIEHLKKLICLLLLAVIPTAAFAITDAQLFAYAQANYSSLFPGVPTAGQITYLGNSYDYRYYSASQNYLGVDTAGTVFVLGSVSGGALTSVGTLPAFAGAVTAWEASRNPSCVSPQVLQNGACVTPISTVAANANSALGTNLDVYKPWNPDWIMVDQFAKTGAWAVGTRVNGACGGADSNSASLPLDANGWVTDVGSYCPHTTVLATQANFPAGTYVALWDGTGTVSISGAASNVQTTGANRATFSITDPARTATTITIPTSSPADYVRNIRVIMPGGVCGTSASQLNYLKSCATPRGGSGSCDAGQTCYDFEQVYWNRFTDAPSQMNNPKVVFHPASLQALAKYRSIRFMKWFESDNMNKVAKWADRTPVTQQNQTRNGYGIAYEYALALANVLNADPWLNIPHQADDTNDTFNTRFAGLTKSLLKPNLKVYLEYSNEVWNLAPAGYTQSTYVLQQEGCVWDANSRQWTNCPNNGRQFYINRARQVMNTWSSVYGGQSGQLVRVLAGWSGSSWWTAQMLKLMGSNTGASKSFDAFAIAPYFQDNWLASSTNGVANAHSLTLDSVFQEMFTGGVDTSAPARRCPAAMTTCSILDRMQNEVSLQVAALQGSGLEMIGYEGGQSLVAIGPASGDSSVVNLFTSANRDARMGTAYTQFFNMWKAQGGHVLNHYSHIRLYDQNGAWGSMEYEGQTASPKYQALQSFIDSTPCWWSGCGRGN